MRGETGGLDQVFELDLAPAAAGLAVALQRLAKGVAASLDSGHLGREARRNLPECAVVAGTLLVEFAREFPHLLELVPKGFRRRVEIRLAELALGLGGLLETLDGLVGGLVVGRAGLLVALLGGGAGDRLDLGTGVFAAEAFSLAEPDEVEDGADEAGDEKREEERRGHGRDYRA